MDRIDPVTADGAYNTRRCDKAILDRDATPIHKNGAFQKKTCPAARAQNATLSATRYYSRALWKRQTGYHDRSRTEARMRGLKSLGERIAARAPNARPVKSLSASPS